jgi:hypothetical protein
MVSSPEKKEENNNNDRTSQIKKHYVSMRGLFFSDKQKKRRGIHKDKDLFLSLFTN